MRTIPVALLVLVTGSLTHAQDPRPDLDALRFFESRIRPLLLEHCQACHSAQAKKVRGGLRLDSRADWLKGGISGPALVAGKPEESLLIKAIRRHDPDIAPMPPEKELTREQIQDLVDWIRQGAVAPLDAATPVSGKPSIESARQRWPFTPVPSRIPVPAVKHTDWPRGDVDHFILARLEAKNLLPVGNADRRTLLRRVTYDLIGLPPTVEEVEAFTQDQSPQAFERVIDRLLASPHYGERWGRHWLDVVRYADTAGDNSDFPVPQLYLYRNWVIEAFNRDLPFDQFVKEQIAGDLLGGSTLHERQQRIIATGYIASARRFGSRVDDYPQHLTIEDTLDNLGRAFMGLTLNCARCHDHKFDPISMRDYYGLYGIFHSTRYPWPGIELEQRQRDLVPLVDADRVDTLMRERDRRNKDFENQLKDLFKLKANTVEKTKQEALQKQIDAVKKEQREVVNAPLPVLVAYAVAEAKKRENVAIQVKGDPGKPGSVVPRGFLEVLGGQTLAKQDDSSGRLALANWIASADNPLFARVFVNRVWHHHFGRGLVSTPNDFGKQGQLPTHPELLDHLARTFINDGWSVKRLHKHILLSRVYQLGSVGTIPGVDRVDPNNELLWKFRRHRLDAESLRDALLMVGGNLDRSPGGAHPFPDPRTWAFTQHHPFRANYETSRRSVYLMTQRIQRHPYLAIFDGADTSASTGSRITSTTALQSLYFLNDAFVHAQASSLAKRLRNQSAEKGQRIDQAYKTLFARSPDPDEMQIGQDYLEAAAKETNAELAWESYVRSLLRLNEFVYLH